MDGHFIVFKGDIYTTFEGFSFPPNHISPKDFIYCVKDADREFEDMVKCCDEYNLNYYPRRSVKKIEIKLPDHYAQSILKLPEPQGENGSRLRFLLEAEKKQDYLICSYENGWCVFLGISNPTYHLEMNIIRVPDWKTELDDMALYCYEHIIPNQKTSSGIQIRLEEKVINQMMSLSDNFEGKLLRRILKGPVEKKVEKGPAERRVEKQNIAGILFLLFVYCCFCLILRPGA